MSLLSGIKTSPDVQSNSDDDEKNLRHEMRKKYHGVILATIAEQIPIEVDGEMITGRLAIAAWKEFFRNQFHPGRSTESLSDEEFSDLINEVEAHGAQELGVTYPPAP